MKEIVFERLGSLAAEIKSLVIRAERVFKSLLVELRDASRRDSRKC